MAVALRKVVAPFMAPPPAGVTPPASPFNWGDPEWLRESLRDRFDLVFEQSELTQRLPDSESAWNIYRFGFGPVRAVANALDADRLEEMRAAFIDWVDGFRTDLGVAIPLRYCVSVAGGWPHQRIHRTCPRGDSPDLATEAAVDGVRSSLTGEDAQGPVAELLTGRAACWRPARPI
jgi:hypothetical protein